MPPYAVEPGTRLVDRYRLDDHLGEQGAASFWRALDEILDRPVGVYLLDADTERSPSILSAARRAATVMDPRFLRVLDADETDGMVYVVTEWVNARNLTELLADGPVPPTEARTMVAEVAEALAAAHRVGLAHLCLQPEYVLRTSHGQLKVVGLAVEAALRGITAETSEDAARRDAAGCGALLYATLTARWPGTEPSGLPDAPYEAGELCTPRQVRAGVPVDLDQIAVRALGQESHPHVRHPGAELTSPREVADNLAAAHVTARIPALAVPAQSDPSGASMNEVAPGATAYDDRGGRRGRLATRAVWVATVLVLLVGLGLAGWQLLVVAFDAPDSQSSADPTRSSTDEPATQSKALDVASVQTFDPPPEGNGEENDEDATNVIDHNRETVWTTKSYFDPFGPSGIKDGVGLVLDLGRVRSVTRVQVDVEDGPHDIQLRAATERGAESSDYELVTRATAASGRVELRTGAPVSARYLLVWMTSVPSDGNAYRGTISEITVRGAN